jgi:hypothetical protein
VFLQGSYGNDTNIYAESDVDIVINLDDAWFKDLDLLSQEEKDAYAKTFPVATYGFVEFKRDVLEVLTDSYGSNVKAGNKAIVIAAQGNRRKADVVVAVQFRRYYKFNNQFDQSYEEGICFLNAGGEKIVNYPKQHSANLTRKHQETNEWLKPMIRVLKNLRGKLVNDHLIQDGVAPSYYLEGLLYNVPSEKFMTSFEDCFVNAINWIQKDDDKNKLLCANEQYYLLRDNLHTCWPPSNCEMLLKSAIQLWNNW